MLISLVAGAYLTNIPNLQNNSTININKSLAHNKNFCKSAVSLSLVVNSLALSSNSNSRL